MADKNLFLYNLAVVTIMKDEGRYLKEWLDYHLLAGVDHFYLYDNGSTDNQAEVAAPYVEAGLVDYIPAPGKVMQMAIFNDAVKKFKFLCQYMAFIDSDEFIFPKTNQSIGEVVDEILSRDEKAAGLAINWQCFGSNGHETADFSRGVMERFTRRAPNNWIPETKGNAHVKTIANPRSINFMIYAHHANYFETLYAVNENGKIVNGAFNEPVTVEKICVNHYYVKSREEFVKKTHRGRSDVPYNNYSMKFFEEYDRNDVFDDSILNYCAVRAENFSLENTAQRLNRVTETLSEILSDGHEKNLETALTCLALSSYLRENFPVDGDLWQICEETSLAAVLKSLKGLNMNDAQLLISELPKILRLPYPEVKELRAACLEIIPQMMEKFRENIGVCREYLELDYLQDLLKIKEGFV